MNINIVTNFRINQIIKQSSKYYQVNLGNSITLENRSGDRETNPNDEFAYVYKTHFQKFILKQGSIGDINFYTDHHIHDDIIYLYINQEDFTYDFDLKKIREMGMDSFLGEILKNSKEEYQLRTTNQDAEEAEIKRVGDADKVITNPGSVRFEDIKAFYEKMNKERLKS